MPRPGHYKMIADVVCLSVFTPVCLFVACLDLTREAQNWQGNP